MLQGDLKVAKSLTAEGTKLDETDKLGAPLHYAAWRNHVESVKLLLDHENTSSTGCSA